MNGLMSWIIITKAKGLQSFITSLQIKFFVVVVVALKSLWTADRSFWSFDDDDDDDDVLFCLTKSMNELKNLPTQM